MILQHCASTEHLRPSAITGHVSESYSVADLNASLYTRLRADVRNPHWLQRRPKLVNSCLGARCTLPTQRTDKGHKLL